MKHLFCLFRSVDVLLLLLLLPRMLGRRLGRRFMHCYKYFSFFVKVVDVTKLYAVVWRSFFILMSFEQAVFVFLTVLIVLL